MPFLTGGKTTGNGLDCPFQNAGVPTTDVTYLGQAVVGSLLIDTANGQLYQATVATAVNVTWVKVGAQV